MSAAFSTSVSYLTWAEGRSGRRGGGCHGAGGWQRMKGKLLGRISKGRQRMEQNKWKRSEETRACTHYSFLTLIRLKLMGKGPERKEKIGISYCSLCVRVLIVTPEWHLMWNLRLEGRKEGWGGVLRRFKAKMQFIVHTHTHSPPCYTAHAGITHADTPSYVVSLHRKCCQNESLRIIFF